MKSLEILHLSDFHFGLFRYDDSATLAIQIADILTNNSRKVDIVIVSGDIFDGRNLDSDRKKNQDFAISFFKKLIDQLISKEISLDNFDENCILFVPGNHDLNRKSSDQYEKYDSFIEAFYPTKKSNRIRIINKYNFICDFPEKKIAILGFNSCRIELDKIKEEELKWIDQIDLSKFKGKASDIRDAIKDHKKNETHWDDYGYIDPIEMDNVFTALKKEIPSFSDYNLVATFHHHFYPFPEIVGKNPDASFIRNYTSVLEKFQNFRIQLVLHGHKHMPIQRAITDNTYFTNPESIIYVLSAGSIGYKHVDNPSFQWLRVYDKNSLKLVDGDRYDFTVLEQQIVKEIILPPKRKEGKGNSVGLLEILQTEDSKLYAEYKIITDDFEQAIQDSNIEKVIDIIGDLLTGNFKDIELDLRKNTKIVFALLLSLNYRIIYLKQYNNGKKVELTNLLNKLEDTLLNIFEDKLYAKALLSFLSSDSNSELDKNYHLIIKNVSGTNKRFSAYISIGLFLSDLFLNISQYGEYYFDKEKLKHKINIKLGKDLFYKDIPNKSISIESDADRRAIILNFKCKDPTVHKVAVLIVKDFEMRLNKFDDSLKEIKLKLYYILPRVESVKYDLENFHFDAYIPTLLPLLTGDNLYKQKEVFIRELVQNCIDATLLRKKIQPTENFNTDINIELGIEIRGNKPIRYFKITDNGIGMSKFTVERYFTSIGRSFYVSDEFDELQKDNKIKYDAISNFGIGFLSSFMVCKEVIVKTKNIFETENNGLEIEIPNYEGCFFIRKVELENFGTEIILYEDDRQLFDFEKFTVYIKNTLVGLNLPVNVVFNQNPSDNFTIDAFKMQKDMLNSLQQDKDLIFYIPFSEETKQPKELSWNDLQNSNIETLDKFGIAFNFSKKNQRYMSPEDIMITSNQGLRISSSHLPFEVNDHVILPNIKVNYPSSFIQLDVAREKVVKIKDNVKFNNTILFLRNQILNYLHSGCSTFLHTKLIEINYIEIILKYMFNISKNHLSVKEETYTLKVNTQPKGFDLTIVKLKDIITYDNSNEHYFNFSINNSVLNNLLILSDSSFVPLVEQKIKILNLKEIRYIIERLLNGKNSIINFHKKEDKIIEVIELIYNGELTRIMERFNEIMEITPAQLNKDQLSDKKEMKFRSSIRDISQRIEVIEMREVREILNKIGKIDMERKKLFSILFIASISLNDNKLNINSSLFISLIILKSIIFSEITTAEYNTFKLSIDFDDLFNDFESWSGFSLLKKNI